MMDLLNNYSVVNDGILTIDNCKTICESYLVNTNYQFMTFFYLALTSLFIYKIFISQEEIFNINFKAKEIIEYLLLNFGILMIVSGILFFMFIKYTGGLI